MVTMPATRAAASEREKRFIGSSGSDLLPSSYRTVLPARQPTNLAPQLYFHSRAARATAGPTLAPADHLLRHPGEDRDPSCRHRGAAEWIPAFAGMTKRMGRDDEVDWS